MTAGIRTAIVEDEPPARRRLERLVAARPDLVLVGSFDSPVAARAVLGSVQLLFLDVEMPFEDGFSFLASLPEPERPFVIFATAHGRHAVRAFRHDAVDFLLKPFDESDFDEAVARARRRIEADALRRLAAGTGAPHAGGPPLAGIRLQDGEAQLLVPPERIDWVRAEGRAILVSTGGRVLRGAGRLADYEARLAAHGFLRVHRSCVVNLARVRSVLPRSHGDRTLVLEDGQRIEMTRHFAQRFDARTL